MPQLEIKQSGNETERVREGGGGGGGDKQECVFVCVERQRTVPLTAIKLRIFRSP